MFYIISGFYQAKVGEERRKIKNEEGCISNYEITPSTQYLRNWRGGGFGSVGLSLLHLALKLTGGYLFIPPRKTKGSGKVLTKAVSMSALYTYHLSSQRPSRWSPGMRNVPGKSPSLRCQ